MNVIKTNLRGCVIIEPKVFGDNRGWFTETYSRAEYERAGIFCDFLQDNHSYSKERGTLRGLHFQKNPAAQAKLVCCTRGKILDVAVDIRRGSDTYLQRAEVELSEENKRRLFIPRGFLHGFITLTENAEIQYKVDNLYSKEHDACVNYADPALKINWGTSAPILSDKDKAAPRLKDSGAEFTVKVLVTGARGQLGRDAVEKFKAEKYEVLGADKDDFDIIDRDATRAFIRRYNPDVIIHCSAYTAVDKAEEDAKMCREVNAAGSANIAEAAAEIDAKCVYISTDYVYGGAGDKPFETTDKTSPLSVYGRTKLEGEEEMRERVKKLFVVRTSWVFGAGGNNFVKTMLRLGREKTSLNVVSDQVGSPTYTRDLADFLFYLAGTQKYGTYHFTNEGFCSWYDFAKEIFKITGIKTPVNPVPTAEYKTAAKRPLNSRLSKSSVYGAGYGKIPAWTDALKRYLKETGEI